MLHALHGGHSTSILSMTDIHTDVGWHIRHAGHGVRTLNVAGAGSDGSIGKRAIDSKSRWAAGGISCTNS